MRRLPVLFCVAVCISSLSGLAAAADAHYKLTDIGDLTKDRKSSVTFVSAINEKGDIVGQTFNDQLKARAFIYRGGRMTDLGDTGLLNGKQPVLSAFGINQHAAVVGTTMAAVTSTLSRGFYWNLGIMLPLGTLRGMGTDTFATAINDKGDIVGAGFRAPGDLRALRYVLGIPLEIGALADGRAAVQAFDVNNRGEIVGYLSPGGTVSFAHAFIWRAGKFTDLGTLPGTNLSFANALNEKTQVVGQSLNTAANTSRAFLWDGGTLLDLGKAKSTHTNSEARAISKKGAVVGTSGTTSMQAAWLWQEGVTRDLNTLVATADPLRPYVQLVKATGVNDKGQIVVQGFDRRRGSSFVRGYLLTPTK